MAASLAMITIIVCGGEGYEGEEICLGNSLLHKHTIARNVRRWKFGWKEENCLRFFFWLSMKFVATFKFN